MRKRLSGKRYDKNGHMLRQKEYQRKDGRYEYKYMTIFGERKSIYAASLKELREKEEGLDSGLKYCRCSVEKVKAEWACITRVRVSEKTFTTYECTYVRYINPVFATRDIKKITQMEIEKFYLELHTSKGLKVSTVEAVHTVLYQIFEIARKKRVISVNPAEGAISCLRQAKKREENRKPEALTKKVRDKFVVFLMTVYSDCALALLVCLMALTGCRYGEVAGIIVSDIDFENNTINITHSISYGYKKLSNLKESTKCGFVVSDVKTVASERKIPFEKSELILRIQKQIRKNKKYPQIKIGSYKGFIFIKETGAPYTNKDVNNFLKKTTKEFNALEIEQAKKEDRKPLMIPEKISSHIFRRTAATIMSDAGYQLPDIQNLLGHVDTTTTVNRYCCPDLERAREVAKTLGFSDID